MSKISETFTIRSNRELQHSKHTSGGAHPSWLDRRDVRTNAVSDSRTGRLHGFVRKVRIASGCLNLRVTEELADHRQTIAKGQSPGREAVPHVVKSCCAVLLALTRGVSGNSHASRDGCRWTWRSRSDDSARVRRIGDGGR